MKLKAHDKQITSYSEVDKIVLIPKKIWEDFELGKNNLKINGNPFSLRVYDLPCDCNKQMHTHRVIDLREVWGELNLKDGQVLEIER